jgi:hypothetical protein
LTFVNVHQARRHNKEASNTKDMLRDMKETLGAVEHCENVKGHQELFSSNNRMLGNIKGHRGNVRKALGDVKTKCVRGGTP